MFYDDRTADDVVAISLITGYLGSGKTTLLNRLLQHPEIEETAVLINEFGEIGLDQGALRPSGSRDFWGLRGKNRIVCQWPSNTLYARSGPLPPPGAASSTSEGTFRRSPARGGKGPSSPKERDP